MTTDSELEVIFGTRKISHPSLFSSVIKLTDDAVQWNLLTTEHQCY